MPLKLTWLCIPSLELYLSLAGKAMTWKPNYLSLLAGTIGIQQ